MTEIGHRHSASRTDDSRLPRLAPGSAEAAQRIVAANSVDAEEASMFLDMLGIHPKDWSDHGDL